MGAYLTTFEIVANSSNGNEIAKADSLIVNLRRVTIDVFKSTMWELPIADVFIE